MRLNVKQRDWEINIRCPSQEITIQSRKYNYYKRTAISWHLRKQVGVIAYPIGRSNRFSASQEDKYRDKINKNKSNKLLSLCHSN